MSTDDNYIMQSIVSPREAKLPSIKLVLPLSFPKETIQGAFKLVANKLMFKIIDTGENYMTAVHQIGLSIRKLLCCFQSMLGPEQASAVKLIIRSDEQRSHRLVTLKSLSGVHFVIL